MASFRLMTRVVVTALALVAVTASSGAQTPQYRARLSPVPLDIAMQSTIAGSGSATATLKGTTLTISGTFAGLKTPATVARAASRPENRDAWSGDRRSHRHRGDERNDHRIDRAHQRADRRSRGRPALRDVAQREGAGRKSVGLVARIRGEEMKRLSLRWRCLLAFAAVLTNSSAGQAPAAAPSYTAAQATAGQASYQANCASCHLPDLAGQNEAPPLRGANFMTTWRARTTRDLVDYMQATMPPGRRASAEGDYVNIAAFILRVERRGRGHATAAALGRGDDRQRSPPGSAPRSAPPLAAAGMPRRRALPGRRRRAATRCTGEVKNYVPVTDAMLKNPPPGDWLMARRNYQAWSYSPLEEITRSERQGPEAGVELVDERDRRQPADAARPQRRHVSRQHRQHDAGARRRHRRSDLGEPGRSQLDPRLRRRAQHRDLRRQGVSGHQRRPPRGLRRAQRQGGVGRRRRRIRAAASPTPAARSSRAAR